LQRGNDSAEEAIGDEIVALADQKGERFYKAFGLMMRGLVLAAGGEVESAGSSDNLRARRLSLDGSDPAGFVRPNARGASAHG
jgi:hypothetical protein